MCAAILGASGAFALLGACLGIGVSHEDNAAEFRDPVLPGFLEHVTLRQLRIGESQLDLRFHRHGGDVTLGVLKWQGDARVMLMK